MIARVIQLSRGVATKGLTVTVSRARTQEVSPYTKKRSLLPRRGLRRGKEGFQKITSRWLGPLERRIAESGREMPVMREFAAPAGVPRACCESQLNTRNRHVCTS